jgi:molecular chaperone IbpA
MTTLFPQLRSLDPFAIGFDKIFKQLQDASSTMAKNAPNWPPYNIKQVSDDKYVIEMAVAGFAKQDIEITLSGNDLVIKGESKDADDEQFLWKGIANRAFQRTFTLNDKIEIRDAEIANGMLKVWLENIYKTQETIKKISIKDKETK